MLGFVHMVWAKYLLFEALDVLGCGFALQIPESKCHGVILSNLKNCCTRLDPVDHLFRPSVTALLMGT